MQETSELPSNVTVTDPVHTHNRPRAIWQRCVVPLLCDERDLPFVKLAAWLVLLFVPLVGWMFWPGQFRWWAAVLYWALYFRYLGPFVLMLHNTVHRRLFKRDALNKVIPWVLGPLVGVSPETYASHHLGIHHVEGNLPADLSSTMPYQRDSFIDFLKYFGRFIVGHGEIAKYLAKTGRRKLLMRFWKGEAAYLTAAAVALAYDWRPAVVVFVIPTLITRFMFMVGNWSQHAFVDPDDPTNDYCTVTTFINSKYNHRCFNDGYHLGHHIKGTRHWLEMPQDFLKKQPEMIKARSIVFEKIDYFVIFALLMLKRYRTLSGYIVDLGHEGMMGEGEWIALLKHRVKRFTPEQMRRITEPPGGPSGS